MNGFPIVALRNEFDKDEYQVLLVANKYQTGFDQSKLCAMYVDKKVKGGGAPYRPFPGSTGFTRPMTRKLSSWILKILMRTFKRRLPPITPGLS
jgi:hypothetical protein